MNRKTDFAILGILTLGPQSGYDIKKLIRQSIGYFWQESYGQLYPALKELVENGQATMRVETKDGKPDKKIYQITDLGKERLRNWLAEPIDSLPVVRNELLLKLFFGKEVSAEINIGHLQDYKAKCENYIQELTLIKEKINRETYIRDHTFWLITISNGLHAIEAEINWCNESIKILQEEKR